MSREPTKSAQQPPVVKSATAGFARLDGEAFPVFEAGWVWLVGAGPGAPGLMSLLCYHAMQNCDVVVYDALVNPDILRWVRQGVILEYAGKRGGKPSPVQQDISLRLIELARAGKRVLRLKGGDPFMFGRGGEESQALAKAKIPFRIVPGITAGVGGLAYAGIPSTHRDTNHSVIFLTGHDATGKMPANVELAGRRHRLPRDRNVYGRQALGRDCSGFDGRRAGAKRPRDHHFQRLPARTSRCRQPRSIRPEPLWPRTIRPPPPSSSSATPPTGAKCSIGTPRRSGRMPLAKAFVVAAPSSGSGKTMLTLGLLRAFRNRGLRVASAKVGPDHIDPRFHEAASGRPCLNLDPWAMKREVIASLLTDLNHDADLVIVEGVMGLFDGPQGAKGSTADLAQDMGLPIVLVLDSGHQGQSIAALARRLH